jgi:hypothetical protein
LFNQKTWRRMAENPAAHGEFVAPSKNRRRTRLRKHRENDYGVGA